MRPDVKYMPRDTRDLNFVPLHLKGPLNPTENGWMPVINEDNLTASIAENTSESIFSASSAVRKYVGNQLATLPNGINPNLLPNENMSDELFSYNKKRKDISIDLSLINIEEILREINYEFSEFTDNDDYRGACNSKINDIYKSIQNGYPAIISTFKAYKMPAPIYTILVKKIISVTLEHCKKE